MWIRIIGKIGNSNCVVLPQQLLYGTKWKRGDYVQISVIDENKIMLEKVDISKLSDKILQATKSIPIIKYD